MLKKRILASSMASVMALSTVSVVAFADETATDVKTEAVTRAELKEIVKGFEKFVESEIESYGTTQTEQFLEAYDHAKGVANDSNATTDDATAAYQMLKAVRENMKTYTKDELKALLAECKPDYETENKRDANVEGDLIWTTDSFDAFAIAYADAENCVEYDNGRDITNLYVELDNAYNKLDKLATVTKSQFRAAQKDYEALIANLTKYEDWRRGVCTVKATTGNPKKADGKTSLDLTKATIVTFGELKNVVYGASDIDDLVDKDNKRLDLDEANYSWVAKGDATDVYLYIKAASDKLDKIEKSNVTSDTYIVGAYDAAVEAVKVFNGWKADNTNFARKTNIDSLIKEYHDKYVKKYMTGTAFFAGSAVAGIVKADFTIKSKADIEQTAGFAVNQSGEVTNAAGDTVIKLKVKDNKFIAGATYSDTGADKDLVIKPGMSLLPYVQVISDVATDAPVKDALELFEAYVAESKEDEPKYEDNLRAQFDAFTVGTNLGNIGLDQNDTIKTLTGSSNEYTLIYRALKYAFEDALPTKAAGDKYKIPQLETLISKCYVLAEDVGDFSKFQDKYIELVEARKGALEFVREAKALSKKLGKDYKDGETDVKFTLTYDIGVAARDYDIAKSADDTEANKVEKDTTAVYKALNEVYDALSKEYAKYPVSFGQIAQLIADTSAAADSGAYGKSTDKVKVAVSDLAFKLSTLKIEDETNQPFTSDRDLNKFNRLLVVDKPKTDDEKASKPVYEAYNALKTAIEDAKKESEVVMGDLDGDGKILVADARAALELYLAGEYNEAADMDGNGIINAKDARAILELWLQA